MCKPSFTHLSTVISQDDTQPNETLRISLNNISLLTQLQTQPPPNRRLDFTHSHAVTDYHQIATRLVDSYLDSIDQLQFDELLRIFEVDSEY